MAYFQSLEILARAHLVLLRHQWLPPEKKYNLTWTSGARYISQNLLQLVQGPSQHHWALLTHEIYDGETADLLISEPILENMI